MTPAFDVRPRGLDGPLHGPPGPLPRADPGAGALIKEERRTVVWRQRLPDGAPAVWKMYLPDEVLVGALAGYRALPLPAAALVHEARTAPMSSRRLNQLHAVYTLQSAWSRRRPGARAAR
jgi:hypothetical protein